MNSACSIHVCFMCDFVSGGLLKVWSLLLRQRASLFLLEAIAAAKALTLP